MLRLALLLAVLGALVELAVPAAARAGAARRDRTTFGGGNARTNAAPAGIGVAATRRLRAAWRTRLDGAVNTQPLVVHRVRTRGRRRTLVIVGTEHGRVAALDARTGRRVWSRRVARRRIETGCAPSPDSSFGVTSTPVVDRRAGTVYVVDVANRAWALALRTGRVRRGWPVRVVARRRGEFVWGALALARAGLYVPIGAVCDDGRARGGVVRVSVRHPKRRVRWRTTAGTRAWGGAVWGWGGVSVDRRGDVFAATGNALGLPEEDAGWGEAVVRLSPALRTRQGDQPLSGAYAQGDLDFGTTPVLLDAPGCPPQLVALNKVGLMFLYDRDRLGAGPRQTVRVAAEQPSGGVPLIGLPAWDPRSRTLVLLSSSTPPASALRAGVQAFGLGPDCRLAPRWQPPGSPTTGSPPAIAGGVVYVAGGRGRTLRAYALGDGRALWRTRLRGAALAAPTVADRTLYAADWSGRVWAFRPRAR